VFLQFPFKAGVPKVGGTAPLRAVNQKWAVGGDRRPS